MASDPGGHCRAFRKKRGHPWVKPIQVMAPDCSVEVRDKGIIDENHLGEKGDRHSGVSPE